MSVPMAAFDPLKCGVCARVKEAPQLLACLHSVCRGCLPALRAHDSENKKCPTCNLMPTPINLITPTPTPDFLIARHAKVDALVKKRHFCDSVHHEMEEEAYALYVECNHNYCAECMLAHQKKVKFASHTLTPFKKLDPATILTGEARTIACAEHPEEPVSGFCTHATCQRAICPTCCITDTHQGHARQPLAEAHPTIKTKLLELVTQVEGNRAGMLATMDAITAEIAAGDASLEQGLVRIDALLTSLAKTIEGCKEEVRAAWVPRRAALVEQRADTDDLMKVIDNSTAYTKGLVAMVGPAELARAVPMVSGRLTTIRDGTKRMSPCVQAPAGGSIVVQVDEAAVTKAVKDHVLVVKAGISPWRRDLLGRTAIKAVSVTAEVTPLLGLDSLCHPGVPLTETTLFGHKRAGQARRPSGSLNRSIWE